MGDQTWYPRVRVCVCGRGAGGGDGTQCVARPLALRWLAIRATSDDSSASSIESVAIGKTSSGGCSSRRAPEIDLVQTGFHSGLKAQGS
jgi:hypothetical protein